MIRRERDIDVFLTQLEIYRNRKKWKSVLSKLPILKIILIPCSTLQGM